MSNKATFKKCIVWDLDNTVWDGICLEGSVSPRPEVRKTIVELDSRGILHSISSRGDDKTAMKTLKRFGLLKYFLVPKINWLPKYMNILSISDELGISVDSIAFVDDDQFELEQINYMIPEILTIPANEASDLAAMSAFTPQNITNESKSRRQFYQAEQKRKQYAKGFQTRYAFLKSCAMKLKIRPVKEKDLPRIMELMTRTHQLNTTGQIFDLMHLNGSNGHNSKSKEIYVADLEDRFGFYGTIGVAIVEYLQDAWRILYLAISCRTMGRGIERAFLIKLVEKAKEQGVQIIEAIYRDTGKNKMMRSMYQMIGFKKWKIRDADDVIIFRLETKEMTESPNWIEVI